MCCHVGKQQCQSLAIKETTETSFSETVLPIGMEEKRSDQYEFQHEKVCVYKTPVTKMFMFVFMAR